MGLEAHALLRMFALHQQDRLGQPIATDRILGSGQTWEDVPQAVDTMHRRHADISVAFQYAQSLRVQAAIDRLHTGFGSVYSVGPGPSPPSRTLVSPIFPASARLCRALVFASCRYGSVIAYRHHIRRPRRGGTEARCDFLHFFAVLTCYKLNILSLLQMMTVWKADLSRACWTS